MNRSTGLGVVEVGGAPMVLPARPPARAEEHQPFLDVHLHAMTADAQGPPAVGLCAPLPRFPAREPAQKRDILCNNAARCLRLTDEELARPRGR